MKRGTTSSRKEWGVVILGILEVPNHGRGVGNSSYPCLVPLLFLNDKGIRNLDATIISFGS
jgi:hypothetical protein